MTDNTGRDVKIAISREEYARFADFIRANYGIHLGPKKQALVAGRLQGVLQQKNFASFSDYLAYVLSDQTGEGMFTLIDRITTNHTYFMRESDHFDFFRDQVLPELTRQPEGRDLRIWSAGCSTGEEPYTLAMILSDYLGADRSLWDTKILATDISGKVLEKAIRGEYKNEGLAPLPPQWRQRYFKGYTPESSMLVDDIRKEVIFRKLNLMDEEFPFKKKLHVIFCRNVMIYFDEATKKRLVNKLYRLLAKGGYLFVGHSESLQREDTPFRYVMPAVYRKETFP